MGNHKLIVVRWASAALTAACWAYALVSRFTSFFLAHRTEKMLLLAAVAAVTGLISLFFFHILLSRITTAVRSKVLLRTAALSMLAAAVLLLFILPPLHFPENHLLEIKPHSPEGGLTILSVHRYEMPRRELLDVPPSKLDLIGGWHTDTGSDAVTWTGGADAAIRYERLMQAGIQLVFRSGPGEGGALISWDGEEHIINLHAQVEGKENILLMPALTWRDADLTRKLLVGVARVSEFLGLSALICMLVLLPRVLKLRGTSAILIIASVLLLLMPLVHAADPPVEFRDPQLEAAVRDALGQPEGAIRQHKVQTIARLFASGYGITDLEGIQHLRNLASLNLRDNEITNINLLRHFYTLRELNLRKNNIHDLEPLRNLTGLVYLNIHSNPVDQGLDVLANLVDLETLIMRNVHIGNDHQFLMRLIGLKNLNIRNTSISDLSAIAVLMKNGTLQDDINSGTIASLNILENDPLPVGKGIDPYGILIPYWDNITYRYPVSLPYFPRDVDPPVFSQESGFYESGFYLTLSAGESGGSIYYTLDGSDPSLATQNDSGQSTKKYDSPILIQNRVGDSNQLANIYTSHPGLYDHIPPSDIFKSTVVRAIVVDNDRQRSNLVSHSYFVDEHIQDRYTLPVISIATHPDGLFDDETGIYVPGKLFEKIAHPNENPANYTQRGLKWEKPAYIHMFSPKGKPIIAQNAGIRINGEATRWYAQKSLRLIANSEYDSRTSFDYDFFPALNNRLNDRSVDSFHVIILRNSGQDCFKDMFQDAMAHSLLEHSSLDIQGSLPVIVFINGEYWGVHNIRTRYDENYFQSYYGIQKEDLAVLENDLSLSIGDSDDIRHFRELLNLIDSHYSMNGYQTASTLSDSDTYAEVTDRMDIDNFIDLYTSQIYFKNTDWPGNNMIFWRKKVEDQISNSSVPYGHDGKWRWMLTDTDFGFTRPSHNTLIDATRDDGKDWYNEPWSTYLIRSLLENENFRISFINRFADHLNTAFREEVVINRIDQFEEIYLPEMEQHIHRWGPRDRSFKTWRAYVENMRSFARLRPSYLRQHIIDYFDLSGVSTVTLLVDSQKGFIRINNVDIATRTPGVGDADQWSGIYFQGVPVSLSAIPRSGYRFVGWEGIDHQNADVALVLDGDLTLQAKFSSIDP